MGTPPRTSSPDRNSLLLDFPVRLYTALRTIRIYPASNPQVQRSNDFVLKAFAALLEDSGDHAVNLAVSDGRILVGGERLADKDHSRPQIQGLIALLNRLKIHSFTFQSAFSFEECLKFTQTISALLGEKELTEPVAALLDKAGIASVLVDAKRYVAIHDGEQVVRDELIGSGLNISDEELANFVLGKTGVDPLHGVSAELVQELINRLPAADGRSQRPEEVTKAVVDFLRNLSQETDLQKRALQLEHSAAALSGLDPTLLAKLVASLPASPTADAMLGSALHQLTPQRLNSLIANLAAQQAAPCSAAAPNGSPSHDLSALTRLAHLENEPNHAINQAIARHFDARQLLGNPATSAAELPEHLLQRLQQPEWSAPVLATAAQQVADAQGQSGAQIDFNAFNRMLGQYEQLLSREQQGQVARQAGAQLASMEGLALGNILAQKFKGLFGEQLYSQVINQVSDQLLDETVEHLTPKQLNRMVATLTSDIPLQIGKERDPDFKPADDSVLKRLAQTRKGPEITKAVAQNLDARQLLVSPNTTVAELPEHLRQRLQQPEWSAPVLATAAQQVVEAQNGQVDFAAFNNLLARYEQLLSREQQGQVARQAGAQLASMEGLALGHILSQKFKGLFGKQLYSQVVNQVSDQLLDETVEHLTPKQLNRMVATLTSDIPLQIGKDMDPDFKPADDSVLKRLIQTKKGPEITRTIAQNIDARQLLINHGTTAAELPEHLLQRIKQPEWSAPVLATAAQQVVDPDIQAQGGDGQVDFATFNTLLGRYEQLLSREQQGQVARQAGAQLASMEGVALGNILAQKFKGIFGQQLYTQVVNQISDELLDKTVDHLTPKQLNRMIVALTSDLPLQVDKNKDLDFKPDDDSILKRLSQTHKGPEITKAIALNIDAQVLRSSPDPTSALPDRLAMRLQQPAWSAPVLVAAAQQSLEAVDYTSGTADFSSFEHMLERYDTLLNKEKQLQVATQAGARIAAFDEKELGLILVQKYKNLFGEQLYQQVIAQLSEDKLERLTAQFQALVEGRAEPDFALANKEVEAAYNRLLQTVRGEKMRAIIAMHREQQKLQEQERSLSIRGGLDKLLNGDLKDLASPEICQALPDTVKNLLLENDGAKADNLLMQLAAALQHTQPEIGANAFQALAEIAGQLAQLGEWERLAKLLPALQQGLQLQEITAESSKQALAAIGRLTAHRLTEENYALAYETAHFLQITSTATGTPDSAPIRAQALETLKSLCSPPVLEQLLDRHLHSEPHQEIAGKLLVELGMDSARFQLEQLIANESRYERNRLLALIKQTGNPAISILLEQLHKDSPWFVVRNVIRLLGEIGNPALFATVRPFINHSDLRVQQEVISTAVKIGGNNLKDFLLHALQNVDDSLKIKVIAHVAQAHDERFVRPLTDLLESAKPFLGKNKNDLQISICKTLGAIGSKRATAPLNRVVQSKNVLGLAGYSDEVRQAADHALEQIRQASPLNKERGDEASVRQEEQPSRPLALMPAADIQAAEAAIFALVGQGQPEQAKKQLLDLIAATARAGDFPTAERLRERIYEIDNLPLGEIIRSGEIIDEEKRGAVKDEDLEIWSDLTDRLSSKEFESIYHEFIERRYKPEETIVAQGDKNDALFFINQGSVKVSHLVGSRELFITSLNRGQIAGENFFTPSFWTVTLTSLTPSRLYILPQTALNVWQDQFPGLRAKLHEYYAACNNIRSMIEKKGLERRKDQRFTLSRKIQVQPISSLDQPIGRGFRSETADISLGGLAFLIRISRQENARLLLGRRVQVVLPVGGKTKSLTLKGLVIGIQPFRLLENDYSAHFKFDQPLEKHELQSILG